jgi:hypothetical protein
MYLPNYSHRRTISDTVQLLSANHKVTKSHLRFKIEAMRLHEANQNRFQTWFLLTSQKGHFFIGTILHRQVKYH